MKIKSLIISVLLGTSLFCSCVDDIKFGDSFLEKAPGVDMTQDTIFNKAEYARRFLWDTYSKMYYGLPVYWNDVDNKMNMGMFETLSDCWHSHLTWDGVNRMYYTGAYSAGEENTSPHTKFNFTKENTWEAIRKGWIFIENVDRVPDMDGSEKERLKAEAKAIIVTRYFDMFRHFGGLPILEGSMEISNNVDDYYTERATVEETVNFMVRLLDEASAVLPWALDAADVSNWDGRFTKAATMGLKCKVLLFAASPLFNDNTPYSNESPQEAVEKRHVWYGGYKAELWSQCLKACEDFFTEMQSNGRYGLVQPAGATMSDYRTAFRNAYFSRGSGSDNPELLISTRVRYTYSGEPWNYYFPTSCKNGAFTPTQEYVEMFPMADGTPFDWNNPAHISNMFTDRDPRLFETVLVNGASYQGRTAELWIGGRDAQENPLKEEGQFATGYALYKYILDYNSSNNKPTLWVYLRLAEVYLTYAEALMKAGRYDDAIDQIDIVRARVGLKGLKVSNPSKDFTNEKVLMEEILRERACELGFEDVRFFDMIRNKRADLFEKQLHGLRITNNSGTFSYEKFPLNNAARVWWKGFNPKWYLSAFPPNEINKKYGLTQNPGWK